MMSSIRQWIQGIWKKIPTSKYLISSWIYFQNQNIHLLLRITLNDKSWRSQLNFIHLRFQHNNKAHHGKKNQLKQMFVTTFRPLPKKIMLLVYQCTFLSPLYLACTQDNNIKSNPNFILFLKFNFKINSINQSLRQFEFMYIVGVPINARTCLECWSSMSHMSATFILSFTYESKCAK